MALRFIHRVGWRGWNGIYYMPNDDVMSALVKSKFNPIIEDNQAVNSLIKDTDSVQIKKIRNAFGYLFGMKSKTKRESFSADFEMFDEVDLMGENDIEVALQRLEDSPWKCVDYFSTPTLPGFGIDRKYGETDQKNWAMVCPHCSTWNLPVEMPFPECIEPGFLACTKCRRALQNVGGKGEWVAKHPTITKSGYWVSRLHSPNANYARILDQYLNLQDRANFYNRVLGMAYADTESWITKQAVLALCGPNRMATSSVIPTTAGVDVGHKYLKVVISRPGTDRLRDYIWVGTVLGEDTVIWDRLGDLFLKFNVKRYMIDGEPETQAARSFLKKYKRDGWLADYRPNHGTAPPKWNEDSRVCMMDRTNSLDDSFKVLRDRLMWLPRQCQEVEEFADHCSNLKRAKEVDDKHGTVSYNWVHSESDPDHHRHAQNYDAMLWFKGQSKPEEKKTPRVAVPANIRKIMGEDR